MMKSPGQRNPWAEKSRSASRSRETSISASVGLRTHRLDRLQGSFPTRLDDGILAEADREDPEDDETVEGGSRAGGTSKAQLRVG